MNRSTPSDWMTTFAGIGLMTAEEIGLLVLLTSYMENAGVCVVQAEIARRIALRAQLDSNRYQNVITGLVALGVFECDDCGDISIPPVFEPELRADSMLDSKSAATPGVSSDPVAVQAAAPAPETAGLPVKPVTRGAATELTDYRVTAGDDDQSDVAVKIIMKDGMHALLTNGYIASMKPGFPGIDIELHLRRAAQWANDNPGKRKTRRGVRRFCSQWLLTCASKKEIAIAVAQASIDTKPGNGFGGGRALAPVRNQDAGLDQLTKGDSGQTLLSLVPSPAAAVVEPDRSSGMVVEPASPVTVEAAPRLSALAGLMRPVRVAS